MKHVIIGTAGHVDHGKTTLIQALTGVNPDRLKEEQERAMTIDLGFAPLTLPNGTKVSIVDVPGHERFLKNMLAGATGVDVVLLVVAADESVMPQTIEHLNILRLLDIQQGVVAITKCDLVDPEWLHAVEEDVREHIKDTFLAQAPIVAVSATTGKGIEKLRHALLAAVSRVRSRNPNLPYRLPIDRVFTIQGFGTVVTGTLVAGTIRIGDPVELLPQQLTSRVRNLQVHGAKVEQAEAGSRVAVNLVGIAPAQIERGTQIVSPGVLAPTTQIAATLHVLKDVPKPIRNQTRVRFHIGTAEIIGRLYILNEQKQIAPGEKGYIQFRAEKSFVCDRGDRFIVRSYSPSSVIGGGTILDPHSSHRKITATLLQDLQAREQGRTSDILNNLLLTAPYGLSKQELTRKLAIADTDLEHLLTQEKHLFISLKDSYYIHTTCITRLRERAQHYLTTYHQRYPLHRGMPKEEFREVLGLPADTKLLNALLTHWVAERWIKSEGGTIRLTKFTVKLNENQEKLLHRIEHFYEECGLLIPSIEEVSRTVKAPPDAVTTLLRLGAEQGRFFRVGEGMYYARKTLETLKTIVHNHIQQHGTITVAVLRDITRTNRKASLIALEYLDSIGFTKRINENERVLAS